jgi:hypothetical protein
MECCAGDDRRGSNDLLRSFGFGAFTFLRHPSSSILASLLLLVRTSSAHPVLVICVATMGEDWEIKICCMGAGYVGGPTMAVIAKQCPKV